MFSLNIEAGVARLILSRPEARNAIPISGWGQLAACAGEAVADGARLLIIEGTQSGAFCAGADISDLSRFREDAAARSSLRIEMRGGLDALAALDIPVIAAVDGACFGAGVALAMACDIRLAGAAARFAITPAKLGISYPQEDVHRLAGLVGPGQAARLLFSAGSIDGPEAERIGLVERYCGDSLSQVLADLAGAIAENDAESLRILKRGIRLAASGRRQDEEQDRWFDSLLVSDALVQRLATRKARRA